MTKTELLKLVKSSKTIYANVTFYDDRTKHCQLVKKDFIQVVKGMNDDAEFDAHFTPYSKTLWIN